MKKNAQWIMITIVLVFISATGFSQAKTNGVKNSIVFGKIIHDYGTIVQGTDGKCEFKFTNKGKTPLVLSNVTSSCGCTVPIWPKEPIQPGKSGTIKVKYDTKRIGTFNKSVTVISNATNSTVILRIKGNVTPTNK